MTDKQIIINDIDVSECEYYDKNKPLLTCTCEEYPCSECPNCYYKQFKRSEAQCEGMFVTHTDLEKKYKAKEQECERLKNELSTYGATGICETCTEKSVLKCDQLEEENRSLKSELMQTNCYLDADKETIDQLKTDNESLKKQLQFEFDETLLQYSNTIEDLQKQLNNTVMQKCPQCGEIYLNPVGCELYEENQQLKTELEQITALKDTYFACYHAKHEDLAKKYDQLKGVLKKYEECNKYLVEENGKTYTRLEYKLSKTLTEIKEIAEENMRIADLEGLNGVYRRGLAKQILQKISEVIPNEN